MIVVAFLLAGIAAVLLVIGLVAGQYVLVDGAVLLAAASLGVQVVSSLQRVMVRRRLRAHESVPAPQAEAPVRPAVLSPAGYVLPTKRTRVFPIADYDDLSADEVVGIVPHLHDDEFAPVLERELEGADRPEVVEALRRTAGERGVDLPS